MILSIVAGALVLIGFWWGSAKIAQMTYGNSEKEKEKKP